MKLTKRKGFHFLRSYFDVLNELKEDSDKLSFLLSIIDKQFLNEDPKGLKFLPNLCYESQRHSIESSVKGWIRVAKTDLQGNPITNPPTNPPTLPPTNPKEEEVEEKEEEEGKEEVKVEDSTPPKPEKVSVDWDKLLLFFNDCTGKESRIINDSVKAKFKARFKEGYSKNDIMTTIKRASEDEYHKENNYKYLTIEFVSRSDVMERYTSMKETNGRVKLNMNVKP